MDFLGELLVKITADDADLQKRLTEADSKLQKFGDTAKRVGGTLTKTLTVPIAAAAAAAVKLAADFEVSSRKFAKAFQGAEAAASRAVSSLNENFGLANTEATRLLANTGDLLKGFGATSNEALTLSEQTQELAAALAAYNGVPVAQASESITKALLGERESLKLLGVAIRETDVQNQLLANGQENLTGQARLLAQAQATLELAYGQSSDAVASFSDNTSTASFQAAALLADVKDLAVELGTALLPTVKDIITDLRELIGGFSGLTDEQKKTIIQVGLLVAAVGPAISLVGTLATAVRGLAAAFTFLAANPATLAVAAIAGVVLGINALVNKAEDLKNQRLAEEFGDIAAEVGVSAEEFDRAGQAFFTMTNAGATAKEAVDRIAEALEISAEEALAVLQANEDVTAEYSDQLKEVEELLTAQRINVDLTADSLRTEKELTRELEEQLAVRDEIQGKLQSRQNLETEIGNLIRASSQGLITDEEFIRRRIALREDERENLVDILQTQGELSDQQVKLLRDLDFLLAADRKALEELKETDDEVTESRLVNVDTLREANSTFFTEVDEGITAIGEANAEAAETAKEAWQDAYAEQIKLAFDTANAVFDIFSGFQDNEFERREQQIQALEDSEIASEEEITAAKKRLARDRAIADRNAALFKIAVDTASAIVESLPNIPLSILAGTLGAAQAAVVLSKPLPALAEGGFFSGPALIGEAGREFAFPIDGQQGQNAMGLMADRIVDAMGRNQGITNNNNQQVTVNSMFSLGTEAQATEAARRIFPYIEKEAARRGTSIVRR